MTDVTDTAPKLWSNRNFRRMWTATAASSFGSEIADLALPLLALVTLSASAAEVGLVRSAQYLPFLLATLPLGVFVDRRPRQRLRMMVGADLGRFVLIAIIPITVWLGVAQVELLYVVVFAAGVLTVLFQIAEFSFLPTVIRRDQLVDANGKIESTLSASYIAGPGLGGLLVQTISAAGAVSVNALAFLCSALSLRGVRPPGRLDSDQLDPRQPMTGSSVVQDEDVTLPADGVPGHVVSGWRSSGRDIAEGLGVLFRHRYLRPVLLATTSLNFGNEVFVLGMMLYTIRDRGLGAAAIGLALTVGGVGAFAGAWFGARLSGRFGFGRVLVTVTFIGNAATLGVAFADVAGSAVIPLFCVVLAIFGIGTGLANVYNQSLRQAALPESLRGRVFAAHRTISWGAAPVGAAVGGLVATQAGAETAMVTGAIVMVLSTLILIFSPVPRLRRLEDVPMVGARGAEA